MVLEKWMITGQGCAATVPFDGEYEVISGGVIS